MDRFPLESAVDLGRNYTRNRFWYEFSDEPEENLETERELTPEEEAAEEAAFIAASCPGYLQALRSARTGGELLSLARAHESGCARCGSSKLPESKPLNIAVIGNGLYVRTGTNRKGRRAR